MRNHIALSFKGEGRWLGRRVQFETLSRTRNQEKLCSLLRIYHSRKSVFSTDTRPRIAATPFELAILDEVKVKILYYFYFCFLSGLYIWLKDEIKILGIIFKA
jgi:hypothetical protein